MSTPEVVSPTNSGVTDEGASHSLWHAKCKNWTPLVDILIFSILKFVVFLRFSGCFLNHFLTFF